MALPDTTPIGEVRIDAGPGGAPASPTRRRAHRGRYRSYTDDLQGDLVRLFLSIRDVVESKAMRRSLPTLLVEAQFDRISSGEIRNTPVLL
jgi:hypothetical protein